MMKTVAVIPAYNEETVIGEVVRGVKPFVEEVVVVDDYSTDQTGESALAAGALALRHPINCGQGAALRTGTKYALDRGAEVVVHFDADGQHDPNDIARLLLPIIQGQAQVVLGSRFMAGGQALNIPRLRRFLLRAACSWIRWWTGLKLTDPQNGLRALTRRAAEQLNWRQDRMAHTSEILEEIARLKIPYLEVPVTVRYSDYSKTKGQKNTDAWRILWRLILGKLTS